MKLLLALAAGVLGYCYKVGLEARAKRTTLREDVTRWEGEGGNLPPPAATSRPPRPAYPDADNVVRH